MKRLFTLLLASGGLLALEAQVSKQELNTTFSDLIGVNTSVVSPRMVQAAPDQFYWLGGSYAGYNLDHPVFTGGGDFDNILIGKYKSDGGMMFHNIIDGPSTTMGAWSLNGDLTIMSYAYNEVIAGEDILPINNASYLEFLVSYDEGGALRKIIPIWDLDQFQYPGSMSAMDPNTGEIYIYGRSSQPFRLADGSMIGEGSYSYIYVIKYSHGLDLLAARSWGFEDGGGQSDYFMHPRLFPDGRGNAVLVSKWNAASSPVLDGDILTNHGADLPGIFAMKLDAGLKKLWVIEGNMGRHDMDTESLVEEGIPLRNGDMIFTGRTATGHISLGEVKLDWEKGDMYSNHFAFRLSGADGSMQWQLGLENMADPYIGKGTETDGFFGPFELDAVQWNNRTLYMCGKFTNPDFMLAGVPVSRTLPYGAYILALDTKSGEELWGYGLASSGMVELLGFDLDITGSVSLMGKSGYDQDFQAVEMDSIPGTSPVFILGLDFNGKPLFKNNGFVGGKNWGYNGTDLEVLDGGLHFATFTKNQPEAFEIGGTALNTQTSSSTMLLSLEPANNVGGMLREVSGVFVHPATVKAYKATRVGQQPAVDSVLTDAGGNYSFTRLYPGNYIFQVIPSPKYYPEGMITYSGGAISWNDARVIPVQATTSGNFLDITLSQLAKLTPEDGSGKASGNVSYSDDADAVNLKGTMGKPAKKTSVLLIKKASSKGTLEDDVVAYVETDDLGNYVFENVPDGEYILIVDIPGLPMVETYDVVIEGNVIVSGLDFYVGGEGISTSENTAIGRKELPEVGIYPNPGNGLVFLQFTKAGRHRAEVYDSFGKLQATRELDAASGLMKLDISQLQEGLYYIKIQGDAGSTTLKYLKQ